ncbi:MAG: hypothetical protein ACXAEI_10150 [Candidatus Hodarchaeales archaeon]
MPNENAETSKSHVMSAQFLRLQGLRTLRGLRSAWDAIRSAQTIVNLIDHAALVQLLNEAFNALITDLQSSPRLISDYNVRMSTIEAVENIECEVMDMLNDAANDFTWKAIDKVLAEYTYSSAALGWNTIVSRRTYSAPRLMGFLQSMLLKSEDPVKTAILMRYFIFNLRIFDDLVGMTQGLSDLIHIAAYAGSLGMTEAYDFRILSHMLGQADDGSLVLSWTMERGLSPMDIALKCLEASHDDIHEGLRELTGQMSLASWRLSDLELISEIGVDVGGIYSSEILEIWRSIEETRGIDRLGHNLLAQRIRHQWYVYQLLKFVEKIRNAGIRVLEVEATDDWTGLMRVYAIDLLKGNEGRMLDELGNMMEYMSGYPGYIVNTSKNYRTVAGFVRRFGISREDWQIGPSEGPYNVRSRHIDKKHFSLTYYGAQPMANICSTFGGWGSLRSKWKTMIADMWESMGYSLGGGPYGPRGTNAFTVGRWEALGKRLPPKRFAGSKSGVDLVPGGIAALERLNELILIKVFMTHQYNALPNLGRMTRGAVLDIYNDFIWNGLRIQLSARSNLWQAVLYLPENAEFFDDLHDGTIWIEDAFGDTIKTTVTKITKEGMDNAEYVTVETVFLRSLLMHHWSRLDAAFADALSSDAGIHTGELALGDLAEIVMLSGTLDNLDTSELGEGGRLYVEIMRGVRECTWYLDEITSLSAAHAYSRAKLQTSGPIDHILCYREAKTRRPVYVFISDKIPQNVDSFKIKKDMNNVQAFFTGEARKMVTELEQEYARGMLEGVGGQIHNFEAMCNDFLEIGVNEADRICVQRTFELTRADDGIPEFTMDLQFGGATGSFLANQVYGILSQAGCEWAEAARKIDAAVELAARIDIDPDNLWKKTFWVKDSVGNLLPPDEILNNFQKGFRKLNERFLDINLAKLEPEQIVNFIGQKTCLQAHSQVQSAHITLKT